jgi:hypothetical protein
MNKPEYPQFVCEPCGKRYGSGRKQKKTHIATWHIGECGVCGVKDSVTEPRDFGHLRSTWHTEHQHHKIAKIVTDCLRRVSEASPTLVDPASLLNVSLFMADKGIRPKLAGIVMMHLLDNVKLEKKDIAAAFSVRWDTAASRIKKARELVKEESWKTIYEALL